jgi:hypothetical protein
MSYKNFRKDIDNIDLFQTYKQEINKINALLSNPLSTDVNKLTNQLIEIEKYQALVVHIHSAAKALKNEALDQAWSKKGPIKHGEAAKMQAEVDNEVKEYTYLTTYFEKLIDIIEDRINLGKKLLGER